MGHGNYLESAGFELPENLKNLENYYRGSGVTHGHWEIEFRTGSGSILPHRNYGKVGRVTPCAPLGGQGIDRPTIKFNAAKCGIELHFPDKPSDAVRAELKGAGFRWSRFSSCWYVKDTPEKRAWVQAFVDKLQVESCKLAEPEKPATSNVQPATNDAPCAVVTPEVAAAFGMENLPNVRIVPQSEPTPVVFKPEIKPAIPAWRQRFAR
ncbi:MAG: hypothetical protein KGL39_36895 [Patescibacteria group bacterium]|nr:hypothetical protein [Patescibacteria group bacterium]